MGRGGIGRRAAVAVALVGLALAVAPGGALTPRASSAATRAVSIDDGPIGCPGAASYCFSPPTLSVHRGDTVTWTSRSGATHNVTRCTTSECGGAGPGDGGDPGPARPGLSNGQSYSLTFTRPGTYHYYCSIHGYATMNGTITVS